MPVVVDYRSLTPVGPVGGTPRPLPDHYNDLINLRDYSINDGTIQTEDINKFFAKLDDNYGTSLAIPAGVRAGVVPAGIYRADPMIYTTPGVGWSLDGNGPSAQIRDIQFNLAYLWNQLRNIRLIGDGGGWAGAAARGVRFGDGRALTNNVQVYQRPIGFTQGDPVIGTGLTSKNVMTNCLTYQCSLGVEAGITGNLAAEMHMIGCDITSSLSNLNPMTFTAATHSNATLDGFTLDARNSLSISQKITGPGIPTFPDTFIVDISPDGGSVTLSQNATLTGTGTFTVVGPGVGLRQQSMGQLRTLGCHIAASGYRGYEIIGHPGPGDDLSWPNMTFHTATIFTGAGEPNAGVVGTTPRKLAITNIQTNTIATADDSIVVTVSPSTEDWTRGLGPVRLQTGHAGYDTYLNYVYDVIAPDKFVFRRPYVSGGPTTGVASTTGWSIWAGGGTTPHMRDIYFTGCYANNVRLEAGFNWNFVGTRINISKWLNSYVGGLFELRCIDSEYGGLGANPLAPNNERVRDIIWHGPGSLSNVMEMGPFRYSPDHGFNPQPGDLAVGMRMAYTDGGLGTWNGPNDYNYSFVLNDMIRMRSRGAQYNIFGSVIKTGLPGVTFRIDDDKPVLGEDYIVNIDAHRSDDGLAYGNAVLGFGAPRDNTAPGNTLQRRGYIVVSGEETAGVPSAGASIMIGASSIGAPVSGPAATLRLNQSMIEISNQGGVDFWRLGVPYIRLDHTKAVFNVPIIQRPDAVMVPVNNGEVCLEATSNTTITLRFKGTDGVVRSNALVMT